MQIQIPFWYVISNSFKFLKIALIKVVMIFMMSAKMATLSLLKIKIFWKKGYDIIIPAHDLTNKTLSRDSNCIVDVVM